MGRDDSVVYEATRYVIIRGIHFSPGDPIPEDWSSPLLKKLLNARYLRPRVARAERTASPPLPPTEVEGFPDLRSYFKYAEWRPMGHSKGVLIGSDFKDKSTDDPVFGPFKNCGFWTVDEVKILFAAARAVKGYWLELGGLTGWSAAHLAMAGCHVASLDPMYAVPEFRARAAENLSECGCFHRVGLWTGTSDELFTRSFRAFNGIVIDGEHAGLQPLKDATNASTRIAPGGVILFHDANKDSSRRGYEYLEHAGWKTKFYVGPHGVALCYRDGFALPSEA